MSDVVKWAAIAALIVVLIGVVMSTPVFDTIVEGNQFLNTFDSYVSDFLNTAGDLLVYARKLVNWFLPSKLVTITIILTISRRPLYLILELASNVVKALYK